MHSRVYGGGSSEQAEIKSNKEYSARQLLKELETSFS
jgi:hypothetical protein